MGASGGRSGRGGNSAPAGHPASSEPGVFRVAVLASGSGSNLQAIIDQLHRPRFQLMDADEPEAASTGGAAASDQAAPTEASPEGPRIEVVLVISDVPGARALDRATRAGIRTATLPVTDYRDREQHDLALVTTLLEVEPDLVVLAGYMRIVAPSLLKTFPWRVINLHPALLPAFPGTHSIADAVRYGVKVTGVTVHFVDPGIDTGPVIAQEAVLVEDSDTADTLAERIHAVEHRLLPEVIGLFAAGRVRPPLTRSRVVQVD
jgi:phosphoribosylglycinamide formyltransferase-1